MQHGLPLTICIWDWEISNSLLFSGPQFVRHLTNVEHERGLTKVGVNYFARRLKPHGRVEVGLRSLGYIGINEQ